MSDELRHLSPIIEQLERETETSNWQIVHDTVADRYTLVLGHDSDDKDELETAAMKALKFLE